MLVLFGLADRAAVSGDGAAARKTVMSGAPTSKPSWTTHASARSRFPLGMRRRAGSITGIPLTRHGILVVVATLGQRWQRGLSFIQSYAVDERLKVKDLG